MRVMNKLVKFFAWLGLQIVVLAELYIFSVLIVSPFLLGYFSVLDLAGKLQAMNLEIISLWLMISVPVCLVMFIYVLIKTHSGIIGTRKKKKEE